MPKIQLILTKKTKYVKDEKKKSPKYTTFFEYLYQIKLEEIDDQVANTNNYIYDIMLNTYLKINVRDKYQDVMGKMGLF